MRTDLVPYADIAEYLKREDTVLIPVGATEQYGPHLATGTELRLCELMAQQVAEITGFAVVPIMPFNYSCMFLDYPGTLTVKMETVEAYLGEMCHGLAEQGFKHFFFVNIHAGSLGPIESICRSLRKEWGAVGGLIDVFSIMRDVAGVTYTTDKAPTGHASEMVTSAALHVCPEYVFMDRVQAPPPLRSFVDGVKTVSSGKVSFGKSSFQVFSDISDYTPLGMQGDASAANAEQGKVIWETSRAYIAEAAKKFSGMVLKPEAA
ncbi:creatininase family protein [Agaricicola taiwanensis]|nr:creatininase family protein [Agaricicola taiwanensis]